MKYTVEQNDNRITVYKDGLKYLEWDDNMHTDEDTYILDHEDLWDTLDSVSEETLDKILSCFNVDFKGKQYRKNKVGNLIKSQEGQLALW